MEYFDVHNDTVIFMALYLKRQSFPNGVLKISDREMADYLALVKRSLEKGKQYADYDYRFVAGAPDYKEANCTPEARKRLRETTYYYDSVKGIYQSNGDTLGLSLKSLNCLPMTIRPHFYARGYEKALNIIPRRGFSNRGVKDAAAKTGTSAQPGEE